MPRNTLMLAGSVGTQCAVDLGPPATPVPREGRGLSNVIDTESVLRETRDALALLEAGDVENAKRTLKRALREMEQSSQRLFQSRELPRRYFGLAIFFTALHLALVAWIGQPRPRPTTREPVKVVLRLPPRKLAVNDVPGGGSTTTAPMVQEHRRRRPLRVPPVLPPPVVESPPAVQDSPPRPDSDEVANGDAVEPAPALGVGDGDGTGTGSGPGTGPGRGSVRSKARKAWLTHTDWGCKHPEEHDVGQVVVRLRVEVLPDGKPGLITVVKAGPESFTRRALDCARDETYLPALDAEGRPIKGDAEFSIRFVN